MVFESVVADLLNKYLSQYVENLDRTQLKIGIWGGDVVLKNLLIKSGALDELNLPVKIVYGEIGKLTLKIPWKNLYGSSVEASVDSLFMLAVPSPDIKYDAEKEERWAQEAKQAEILRVEIAKQQEKLKDQPKTADTFTEKLAAQIIRNVQIRINLIHVRYEDQSTRPERPFSCGLTLFNLSVVTTDTEWKPHVSSDSNPMIFKLLTLEGFAFYWNPKTFLITKQNSNTFLNFFEEGIATHESLAKGYRYVLGPINSTAKLKMNPKPEIDSFNIPKYSLELDLERLQIRISKAQYRDIIQLMASIELMVKGVPYRKYRPNLKEYKGHAKEWWCFAYQCILEETVRRKQKNWDWTHIKAHRELCKFYANIFSKKLTAGNKLNATDAVVLQQCENELDAFNIILVRQKVENDIERLGRLAQVKKANQPSNSWFSWWSSKETNTQAEDELIKKFEEAMDAEEKNKLYRAIGYQENATPAIYPITFIETEIKFVLHSFEVEIRDETLEMPRVLIVVLKQVKSFFQQRPAAKAFRLMASVDVLSVFGLTQNNEVPLLVSSKKVKTPMPGRSLDLAPSSNLFHILIETNPLDKVCDQRIHIASTSLQIVYDAQTVIKLYEVFLPEKNELEAANVFSAAATVKIAEFKERSSLGFQYTIEKHGVLELKIELMASYCLLPHGGRYTGQENMIVVNLGHISIYSRPPDGQRNIQEMRNRGENDERILLEMMSSSYDKFDIKLDDLQVMVVYPNEKWSLKPGEPVTPGQHLLRPMSVIVLAQKCVVTDDPNLPKLKLNTELPSVEVKIAEGRLLNAAGVLISIPFPESDQPQVPVTEIHSSPSKVNLKSLDFVGNKSKKGEKKGGKELMQLTDLEIKFELKELIVQIDWQKFDDEPSEPLVIFNLRSLSFEMIQQTFNLNVNVILKSLQLIQYYEGDEIKLLSTTLADDLDQSLFLLKYINVNRNSPVFQTHYNSVIQLVEVSVSKLDATIKQDAILFILQWWNHVQGYFTKLKEKNPTADPMNISSTSQEKHLQLPQSQFKRQNFTPIVARTDSLETEIVVVKLIACLNDFLVTIHSDTGPLFEFDLAGLNVLIIMKPHTTEINARLSNISIIDLMGTVYNKNILNIMEQRDVIDMSIVLFDEKAENAVQCSGETIDITITLSMACVRFVYINERFMELLLFLNNFQAGKQAIFEASAAAVQSAKLNMQHAYENATKVLLDIRLNAPVIVLPINVKSRHALILDLGYLTINNCVTCLSSNSALVDNMKLDLQQMKMSCVVLKKQMGTKDECSLLLPINFTLVVKRNLSISWCKDVPDLDITGHFLAIKMALSQQAYSLILQVIEGNLTVSPQTSQVKKVFPDEKPTRLNLYETAKFNISRQKQIVSLEREGSECLIKGDPSHDLVPHSVIKFVFFIDSMELDLLSNSSKKSDPNTGLPIDDMLAKLSLNMISLKGKMSSDSSIFCSIILRDCLVDDLRLTKKKLVTRYMERKLDSCLKESDNMIHVMYTQKDSASSVNVEVCSFILMFNLDFCLKLVDFFTQNQARKGTNASSVKAGATKGAGDMRKKKSTTIEPDELYDVENTMNISVHLQQPDIILVENMIESNSRGIVLNFEMNYELKMTGPHNQVMNGWVRDLQIYSCFFNLDKQKDSLALVLRPVNIALNGSVPEQNNLRIDVETTPIRISVSPATIELLNRIKQTINTNLVEDEPLSPQDVDHSDLWDVKPINENDFWFLKAEEAQEAIAEVPKLLAESCIPTMHEVCTLSIPSIIITIEVGVGNKTLPMLLLESNFSGTLRNWSSDMKIESRLGLEVGYYNSQLALWEPFIEPTEVEKKIGGTHVPWELCFNMESRSLKDVGSSDKVSNYSASKIEISSKEMMQITVSKTCLQVSQDLVKAFSEAVSNEALVSKWHVAPYTLKNYSGVSITLILGMDSFKIHDSDGKDNEEIVILESGAEIPLFLPDDDSNSISNASTSEKNLKVQIPEKNCEFEIPVLQAVKRYYSLADISQNNEVCHLISDVHVENGSTIIILRSVMQIFNHFSVPINVYALAQSKDQLELVGIVEPDVPLNLPLSVISAYSGDIFFRVRGYSICSKSFSWDLLRAPSVQVLQCISKNPEDKDPFFIKAVGSSEKVYFESTSRHTNFSRSYSIHLWPTLFFKNLLPVDVICIMQGVPYEKLLPSGKKMDLPNVEPGSSSIIIRIVNYLEKDWSCKHAILEKPPELDAWVFYAYDSAQRMSLQLGVRSIIRKDAFYMVLYCPFWMINKTELKLSYKSGEESAKTIYHPASFQEPIMFSREKSFFNKTKASVKVKDGEWSDKFHLDVAGNSGMISCPVKGTVHQIGVHIKMMSNSLTKLVTFTPYYVIINKCWFDVNFRQISKGNYDSWQKVLSKTCVPFWPLQSKHVSSEMVLRVEGTTEITSNFSFNKIITILLRLANKFGGINVDIQVMESATYITLDSYKPGFAPAFILNHTDHLITLNEKQAAARSTMMPLPPYSTLMFAWSESESFDHPLLSFNNGQIVLDVRKDAMGTFVLKSKVSGFWVSFLNGMQRTILFTTDLNMAKEAESASDLEQIEQEIIISLHGIGISLVNNELKQEICYLTMTSSGPYWEVQKEGNRRFKSLTIEESRIIEEAFSRFKMEEQKMLMSSKSPWISTSDGKFQIDFHKQILKKPFIGTLRRIYHVGFWLQTKSALHTFQVHAKINHLQIDNQGHSYTFPVIFAPQPLPRTTAISQNPKPFAELSIVQKLYEYSTFKQYKYFKILIQEMQVKVDVVFISALTNLFKVDSLLTDDQDAKFEEDKKVLSEILFEHVTYHSFEEAKNYYDFLHFGPIKLHLSFSFSTGFDHIHEDTAENINILTQSFGVTVTDFNDVVMKLSYLERQYVMLNQRQLEHEVMNHYFTQFIRQFYVIVFGLDVLGNPYKLVTDIKRGVQDFFYEPIQGAIQGPGEFAEGIVLGMRSLFGHTVGGAAGAVSRITGSIGHGLAALTFDKDYQQKRRENYQKKSAQERLATSGKGLVMGVVEGVGGVFTKPISGARSEGFGGFMKGIGIGMAGLITRPTGGLVDFASGSFKVVRDVMEVTKDATRVRLPRYFKDDKVIRPYSRVEAEGLKLLLLLEKGRFAKTDVYIFHVYIDKNKKREVFLITSNRVMYCSFNDVFGSIELLWMYPWTDFSGPPIVQENGLFLPLKSKLSKVTKSHQGKLIFINDEELASWIAQKISKLMDEVTSSSISFSSRPSSALSKK